MRRLYSCPLIAVREFEFIPSRKLAYLIVRRNHPRPLSFLCVSAIYLNLILPASAAEKEEFLSNREVARLASIYSQPAFKKTSQSHPATIRKTPLTDQHDPIADFAEHWADDLKIANHKHLPKAPAH